MCFSPKISTPQVNVDKAPEPAPLTQEVSGVEFGGDNPDVEKEEESGRKSLKVEKTSPKTKSTIRKSIFGGSKK